MTIKKAIALILSLGLTHLAFADDFGKRLAAAAHERTLKQVTYDGRYLSIPYPMGDVPDNMGVCTDVIIRSYRTLGVDLQREVHEDMTENFSAYPSKRIWGLNKPDTNIDHRRVPNLETFFARHGETLTITQNAEDYQTGDLVTWRLPFSNAPHIGIVSDKKSADGKRPLITHNIGAGTVTEDMLFLFKIVGHFRYAVASD